jgi:CheY-like chemotaxis protein
LGYSSDKFPDKVKLRMTHRLALVVDDSKTARVTLKRMLEKHDLHVDTVESAQQALDYLVHKTPGVIFMDHMMPGMDGLQAVQAIKSNPATATIPIMMYTSKEGDLYVSQARALGAIGILPKQVEPTELYEVLNNLELVSERRTQDAPARNRVVMMDDLPEQAAPTDIMEDTAEDTAEDIEVIAREAAIAINHNHETQSHLGELLENYHHEIVQDVREIREMVERLTDPATNRRGNENRSLPVLLTCLVMLIPLLWLAYSNSQARATLNAANQRLSQMQSAQLLQQQQTSADNSESTLLRKQLDTNSQQAARQSAMLYDSITWAINQSSPYDIREEAYSDRRLAIIQELVSRLAALGFTGVIQLDSHLGEFCLNGTDVDGYTLPPADLPVTECTLVGHPLQDLPSLGNRQSIAFANFLATSPLVNNSAINIDLVPHLYSRPLAEYPPRHEDITAYEWNRIAARNNRVEVTLIPADE